MSAPKRWTDLPANAQVDAALRRAAAGVMGWKEMGGWWCELQAIEGFCPVLTPLIGVGEWLPDQSRDDLARVFVAAGRVLASVRDDGIGGDAARAWVAALTDPRAALCALLDLLQAEIPNE